MYFERISHSYEMKILCSLLSKISILPIPVYASYRVQLGTQHSKYNISGYLGVSASCWSVALRPY